MQCPIRFIHGNLVFGHGPGEVWGIYRVGMRSYPGLATRDKIGVLSDLASMLYHLERDCQILRVSRPWSTSEYLRQAWKEGIESGPSVPLDMAEIKAEARRRFEATKRKRKVR